MSFLGQFALTQRTFGLLADCSPPANEIGSLFTFFLTKSVTAQSTYVGRQRNVGDSDRIANEEFFATQVLINES